MEESTELDRFRLNWVNELNNNKPSSSKSVQQQKIDDAVALYYQAAQSEEDGNMGVVATVKFQQFDI